MGKTPNTEAFSIQKRLMTFTGFWPYRTSSIFYRMYGTINYLFVVTFGLSLILSTFVVTEFSKLIQGWSLFVAMVNCTVKFTVFYFKMDHFMDVLDFLKLNHFTYYDEVYDKHLKKSVDFAKFMVRFFFCVGISTGILILTGPLLLHNEPRQTPLPFPLDLTKYNVIVYILAYAFQCIGLMMAAWTSIGFDNLSTSMMGISSAYFRILRDTIFEIIDKELIQNEKNNKNKNMYDDYKIKERDIFDQLGSCVLHHNAVIDVSKVLFKPIHVVEQKYFRLTDAIENIFTYVFLSQFLCSAVGICLAGFTFMNTAPGSIEFMLAFSLLGTLMFQITLYCIYGDAVTEDSYGIGNACYMSEWIYCGRLVRQSLFLIMERSKRPVTLTAGKFIDLSLMSLMAVLKSAASYAAVLRQMTEKGGKG